MIEESKIDKEAQIEEDKSVQLSDNYQKEFDKSILENKIFTLKKFGNFFTLKMKDIIEIDFINLLYSNTFEPIYTNDFLVKLLVFYLGYDYLIYKEKENGIIQNYYFINNYFLDRKKIGNIKFLYLDSCLELLKIYKKIHHILPEKSEINIGVFLADYAKKIFKELKENNQYSEKDKIFLNNIDNIDIIDEYNLEDILKYPFDTQNEILIIRNMKVIDRYYYLNKEKFFYESLKKYNNSIIEPHKIVFYAFYDEYKKANCLNKFFMEFMLKYNERYKIVDNKLIGKKKQVDFETFLDYSIYDKIIYILENCNFKNEHLNIQKIFSGNIEYFIKIFNDIEFPEKQKYGGNIEKKTQQENLSDKYNNSKIPKNKIVKFVLSQLNLKE